MDGTKHRLEQTDLEYYKHQQEYVSTVFQAIFRNCQKYKARLCVGCTGHKFMIIIKNIHYCTQISFKSPSVTLNTTHR